MLKNAGIDAFYYIIILRIIGYRGTGDESPNSSPVILVINYMEVR